MKKRLRVCVGIRKSPLTGGAEAHNGTPDGAAATRQRDADADEAEDFEGMTGGRAKKLGRIRLVFVSTLFEIDGI
ncbi:hypothetical protein ACSQ8B_03345 [Marinovum sp. F03]